jgi:hypothetical protein
LAIAHKLAQSHVIQRHSFLSVKDDVLDEGDSNGHLTGGNTLSGGGQRGYQQWLGGGQVADKLLLREGDTVRLNFPGAPNLNTTQAIRRDGKLALPLVGEVQACFEERTCAWASPPITAGLV